MKLSLSVSLLLTVAPTLAATNLLRGDVTAKDEEFARDLRAGGRDDCFEVTPEEGFLDNSCGPGKPTTLVCLCGGGKNRQVVNSPGQGRLFTKVQDFEKFAISGRLGDGCTISGNGNVFAWPGPGYRWAESANPDGSISGQFSGSYIFDLVAGEGGKGLGPIPDPPSISYVSGVLRYKFTDFIQVTAVEGQVVDVCKILYP